ncbi:MAG: DNA translocase FtsK [Oscillospiraceae bacterium]|nr:DNA translocase FtsK [Oscillospiraceae bacterium]
MLRTVCTLMLPYVFGIFCHLLFSRASFDGQGALLPALWISGRELSGGGLFSGGTALAFTLILGKSASVVVVLAITIILLMIIFDVTISQLIEMWEEYEWLDYDEEDYEERVPRAPIRKPQISTKKSEPTNKRQRAQIDIPLDVTPANEADDSEDALNPGAGFFRPRREDQLTPADLFEQREEAPSVQESVNYRMEEKEKLESISRSETITQSEHLVNQQPISEPVSESLDFPEPILEPVSESLRFPEPIAEIPEPDHIESEALPVVQSAVSVSTGTVEQDVVGERKSSRKNTAEEVEQATVQVAAEIESSLAAEGVYEFPPVTLLDQNEQDNFIEAGAELRANGQRLADTLRSFGVDATAGDVVRGPAITRYEFTLDQGVKLSKITNLSEDIALALGTTGVRIAPIPEKISVVGIEVPNKAVSPVLIRDVIDSKTFSQHKSTVAFSVGRDISNRDIVGDIGKLPHVLIAGTTGSGKSVCTNSLIISLLYKSSPDDVRFIMVDPKMVELAPYNGIPHLLIPVVTDPKKAAGALQWAVYEMMKRYKAFSEVGVKKLEEYNALAAKREDLNHMASVVVVIDELADLMLVAAKEVEESICRVAQMGRAAGMHLVIATQRPSADVITGLMKANIPSRIAFAVASSLESRIILDTTGAEKLVGRGDMLYAPLGSGKPQRVQGCFISPEEIDRVVAYVKSTGEAQYSDEVMQKIEESMQEKDKKGNASSNTSSAAGGDGDDTDELFSAAVDVILETGQASASMLQRRLKLGYSRAARLVDQMEEHGIVGPSQGSKSRQILISKERWQQTKSGTHEEEPQLPETYSEHVIPWEDQ